MAILSSLREFEAERRRTTDPLALPPSGGRFGADPHAAVALETGGVAGILRGSSELVILGADFREAKRLAAPRGAIALANSEGRLVVAGERSNELWVYEPVAGSWRKSHGMPIAGLAETRAIAVHGDRLFIAQREVGLSWLPVAELFGDASRPVPSTGSLSLCHDLAALRVTATHLVANCLLDHELVVLLAADEPQETARIRHDGPIWGIDVIERGGATWIAAVGVEDHPLDRRIGSFGFVDSFLYVYRVDPSGGVARVLVDNLSDRGVVVPKVVHLEASLDWRQTPRVFVAAAGSPHALWLDLSPALDRVEGVEPIDVPPGAAGLAVTSGLGLVLANPLIDAWVRVDGTRVDFLSEEQSSDERERLGEALVFTTLMAPWNDSAGALSRFSCETCHFEGGIDGRTHHTGRGNVRATTKPLFGLFNNRPHFSRALDRDLSKVVHAEFRVAGQNSGRSPVFDLELTAFPWLSALALSKPRYGALEAREALIAFLVAFTPPTNPRILGRAAFDDQERLGAELFARDCESCHQARASTDEPSTRVGLDGWEALIFAENGPLVWASEDYQTTGVLPYVHERGARTPSLRRLTRKWPYFTNGSARDLGSVLATARVGQTFSHAGGQGTELTARERLALLSFLRLL
jgi:hypothetical protein